MTFATANNAPMGRRKNRILEKRPSALQIEAWMAFRGIDNQEGLEAATGLSQPTISRLAMGRGYKQDTLEKLAAAFKCHVKDLFEDPRAKPPEDQEWAAAPLEKKRRALAILKALDNAA